MEDVDYTHCVYKYTTHTMRSLACLRQRDQKQASESFRGRPIRPKESFESQKPSKGFDRCPKVLPSPRRDNVLLCSLFSSTETGPRFIDVAVGAGEGGELRGLFGSRSPQCGRW